jgi:hypothetical protein
MLETILSILAAAAGFMAKGIWDNYINKRKSIEFDLWKIRVNEAERRLREFLWPIYLRLQRDNVVWEKILQRDSEDSENKKVAHQIEKDIILPNHLEVISIIESGMHFVRDDSELESALLAYVRHIDVYRSIRAAEIQDKDPIYFNEPYPKEFFRIIENRVKRMQKEYDGILSERVSG